MIIVGITGKSGSGKGTVVEYLVKKGFKYYSVGDFLKQKLKSKKLEPTRKNLQDIGNELRKKYGPDYVVKNLYAKAAKENKNAVIESIRNPKEAEFIKKQLNSLLLAVEADIRIRYQRIKNRNETKDKVTFKQFMVGEERELQIKDKNAQSLETCMQMANYKLDNNKSLKSLYQQIDEVLQKPKYVRPSWDDYFMEVVEAISKRGTCDRGRAGSVAVRNNQIIAAGYVGSPVGFPHCDDVGHQIKSITHEDGTVTQHCVRTVHSEQNVICQAAKSGLSLEGCTIYTRMTPCRTCAMLLINCGIKSVYCERKYHAGAESEAMFKKAKIKLTYKYNEIQQYSRQ